MCFCIKVIMKGVVMFKITKLMLVLIGAIIILSTVGCGGGGGGDDTIANVAGVWMITVEGDTDSVTLSQNGHLLTMVDPDADTINGEIYGKDVTFEFAEVDEGIAVTLMFELVIDSEESPSTMTGNIKGYADGVLIKTIPMTCVR